MSSRDSVRPTTSELDRPGIPVSAVRAGNEDRAHRIATRLCEGFVAHDERDGAGCRDAFAAVDRAQFPHLTDEAAERAGTAFAAALWEKDAVEEPYVEGDTVVDPDGLAAADWRRAREWL